MTIISTHRMHSYKATSVRHRDISPKKMPYQKTSFNKKTHDVTPKTIVDMLWILKAAETMPVTPPPSPQMITCVEPSAPPAIMTTRTIYVWDCAYTVEIPENFDIYEGLSLWYPSLYKAVIEEQEYEKNLINMEEGLTEDDVETAWAHLDYLEWLCD